MGIKVVASGLTSPLGVALQAAFDGTIDRVTTLSGGDWRLGDDADFCRYSDISAKYFIHVAWDMRLEEADKNNAINVEGSKKIIKQATDAGFKVLFISTLSAHENTVSEYGKAKFEVEKFVRDLGGVVVRPGLLLAKPLKGIIGKLVRLGRYSPILPVPYGGRITQFVTHIDDLTETIKHIVLFDFIPNGCAFANPTAYQLKDVITKLSGKRPIFINVPEIFIVAALRIIGVFGIKLFKVDSLYSLRSINKSPNFDSNCSKYKGI